MQEVKKRLRVTNISLSEDVSDTLLPIQITERLNQLALLTDEELWSAATSQASDEDNDLMQALVEKKQRQGLTSDELEQVRMLSDHFNLIMMVRAKAAVLLAERGQDCR